MSMVSSTPLTNNKAKIMDSTISDVSLTPILYQDVENDPKTPLLRTQYDRFLAKSNNGKIFRQVKLNDHQEVSTDETEEAEVEVTQSHPTLGSILKEKAAREELIDWRTNPTKYAELLFDSKQSKKSKFNSSLPYDEEFLPNDQFNKKLFKYKKEVDQHSGSTSAAAAATTTVPLPKQSSSKQESNFWSHIYKLISDPSIPYTLSLYLQLVLNAVIIGFIILFIWTFVSTIRNDIKKRTDEMTFKLLKEISICSKEYDRNNCHPSIRVPAADKACSVWEHCMNQDPTSVGQVKISFEILAEILNSFVKLLSWKTIFVLMLLMVGSLVVTNLVFDRYRYNYEVMNNKVQQLSVQQQQQQQQIMQDSSYSQYKSPFTSTMVRKDLSVQSPSARFFDYNNTNRKKWE